jgi:hypothetical protein
MNCLSFLVALSMHVGLEGDYNSVHPHARCTLDDNIYGVFYNSEYRISFYAGKKTKYLEYGLVTGYIANEIVPMIRIVHGNWFMAPGYEVTGNTGFVIGWEIEL